MPPADAGEPHGERARRRSPRAPATSPSDEALDRGEHEQRRGDAPARAQERERRAVALDGPECREVGEPERDERAGDGEHDVERLGVERVAGGGVEAVGQVVDEDDLAGQRALDAVADLVAAAARGAGCRSSAAGSTCACTCHCVAGLRAGHRATRRRRRVIVGSAGASRARECRERQDRDVRPAAAPAPGRAAG